jgi:methionyl-tRNA formyltransferase
MRLVFMGTPDFAIPSLMKLISSHHVTAGVVTQPDRPKGRKLRIATPPVKSKALSSGIPVVQPENLADPGFIHTLKSWNADCFAVVAYRILPPEVFGIPTKGTINLHASLLPKYRGAAPIQWALIRGEKETGVTTFFIEKNVDTGEWILQERLPIAPDETAGELHDRLADLGAECLLRTLDLIERGEASRNPQRGKSSTAPKILPEHCKIDWHQSAGDIVNLIRGLSPLPGAFTFWNGKRLKCYRATQSRSTIPDPFPSGTVLNAGRDGLLISAGAGNVLVRSLQSECGEKMDADVFLRGHRIESGTVLGKSESG